MQKESSPADSTYSIELRPNCSLTPRGALVFFASLCVVSFGIGALFASQGFWPVLPFAGLEMLVLGWALRVSLKARHVSQRVEVSREHVRIEAREANTLDSLVFPRHWAKVTLRVPRTALHPSRLLIECRGHACEVGGFLIEEERRELAKRLRQLIGNVNASPPLEGPEQTGAATAS